jgi:hypothetical protein
MINDDKVAIGPVVSGFNNFTGSATDYRGILRNCKVYSSMECSLARKRIFSVTVT